MKEQLHHLLTTTVANLQQQGIIPSEITATINLERTKSKEHGDLATNVAMMLAKACGQPPRQLAELIIQAIPANNIIKQAAIAGPGFINFFFNEAAAAGVITDILAKKEQFGRLNIGEGKKVQVEFVSANPTGPLHVGHGRGAAVGDSLCRLLTATGWQVTKEFYYNDAGVQISNLGKSVRCRAQGLSPESADWPEAGYRGEYINDVAKAYMAGEAITADDMQVTGKQDVDDINAIQQFAVAYLRREQDLDLKAFDVSFDVFYLESSLYTEGKVEDCVKQLINSGHTYENDGALWLKTTDFGDDKDRVMRKSEGGYTYFVPDVAYHLNKWQRGFSRVINEQGADHHSTITRVRAGLQALNVGIPQGWPDYVLHQMVTVMKGGEEVKISKRAGSYVTLRDLIDWCGQDATRYFLVSRAANSQLIFDVDLAVAKNNDNPVYYIQYAHARVCSVQRKMQEQNLTFDINTVQLDALSEDAEKTLLKTLAHFPEVIHSAASRLEPHLIANYLRELAGDYHSYYNAHKILVEDSAICHARVALSLAVKQVIFNGLQLLGVSAPETM